ncbi:MAG: DNA-protecting protein DprA, partial [Deltaproteobacteria bacterium]|nr:DNA-protecting protein DprA [Deltaproteobacteria bacterium]
GFEGLIAGGREALVVGGVEAVAARAWASTTGCCSRGRVLTLACPDYPARLRELPAPPPFVCVQGDLDCLGAPAIAVVGTRRCTAYGVAVARHLAGALAAAGVVVVSGLARGVDSHGHRATLGVGRTVAVLGHGLGHTAPSFNRHLRQAIVEHRGLVVSTWADAVEPRPYHFPIRNQWISGLADAVVVVEAPMRSGALITARVALEQGRDVYAVPGQVGAPASRGCLDLLDQGAGVVVDVDRFVAQVTGAGAPRREDWLIRLFAGQTVEEVARFSRRTTADLLAELAVLEVRGEVVRLPGQRYAPS